MFTVTLAEYIPRKPTIPTPKTYIDLFCDDIYYLVIRYLNRVDRLLLEISQKDEDHRITEEELREAEEATKLDLMETFWYDNYDPYDKYDYQYGNAYDDFSIYIDVDDND